MDDTKRKSEDLIKEIEGLISYIEAEGGDAAKGPAAEERRSQGRELFRSFIECTPNVILCLSPDHRILEFNPEAERLFGCKKEDVLGEDYFELFLPESVRESVAADIRNVLGGEPTKGFENIVKAGDGRERLLRWNIGRVLDPEGKATGVVTVGQDITEQRVREAELVSSEERLKILFESAPDGIFLYDFEGVLVDGNRASEELVGYQRGELIGKNFAESGLLSAEELPRAIENLKKNAQGEATAPHELTLIRKDGGSVPVEIRTYPVTIDGRQLSLGIARDITLRKQAENALVESREQYRTLVEDTEQGITLIKDGRLVFANRSAEEMLGCSFDELSSFSAEELMALIHEEDREWVAERMTARLAGKASPEALEYRVVHKDGEVRWLSVTATVAGYDGGYTIQTYNTDITQRKLAEHVLGQSEKTARALLRATADMGLLVDRDGRIIDLNDAMAKALGGTREDVMGTVVYDYLPADLVEQRRAKGLEAEHTGKSVRFEDQRDGRWLENSVYPVFDAHGKASRFAIFSRDITASKRAAEALRESEERFRFHFELANIGFALTSPKKGWIRVNRHLCEMLDYSEDELREKTWAELTHPEDLGADIEQFEKVLAGESDGYEMDKRFFRRDGAVVYTHLTVSPIRNADGSVKLFIATLEDIGERKRAEEALRKAHDELEERVGERTAQLSSTNEQLELEVAERKLAEERVAIFRKFADASEQGLGMADLEGNITYANATLGQLLGFEHPEEACGTNVAEYYSEENLPKLQEEVIPAVVEQGHHAVEMPLVGVDGKVTPCIQSVFAIRDDKGRAQFLANVITDITERKKAEDELRRHRDHLEEMVAERTRELEKSNEDLEQEIAERKQAAEALRESEEKFRILFELSPYSAAYNDLDGNIVACNEQFLKLHACRGGTEAQVGRNVAEFFPEEEKPLMLSIIRKTIESRQSLGPVEYTMLRDDGTRFLGEVTCSVIAGHDGEPIGLFGLAQDVTERRRAEDAIKESEQRFRALAEKSPNMIFINVGGRVVYANEKCEEVIGYTRDEFYSEEFDYLTLIVPEDRELVKEKLLEHAAGREVGAYEYTLLTRSGERLGVIIASKLIEYRGERGILGIITDIAERKRAEEALAQSEEKYRGFVENFLGIVYQAESLSFKPNFFHGAVEEITGYKEEDFTGAVVTWDELIDPEDFEEVRKGGARLKADSGYVSDSVYRIRSRDGEIRWVRDTARRVRIDDSDLVQGVIYDITEQKKTEDTLSDVLKMSDDIVRTIPSGLFIYKYEEPGSLVLLHGNPEAERLTGVRISESVGKEFDELWPSAEKEGLTDKFLAPMKTGEIYETEDLFYKDERLEGAFRIRAFRLSGDKLAVAFENVTERKRAEGELRKSEEHYRMLAETMNEGLAQLAADGTYVYVNEKHCEIFGYSPDDMLGAHWTKFYTGDAREVIEAQLAGRREGLAKPYEVTISREDGRQVHLLVSPQPIFDEEGEFQGSLSIVTDITALKETEETLRERERYLENVFNSLQDGLSVLDSDLNIVRTNQRMQEMYPHAVPLEGKKCYVAYQQRDALCPNCPTVEAIATGRTQTGEVPYTSAEGLEGWIDLSAFPLKDEHGNVTGVIEYVKDVSERKNAELALRESEERFRTLSEAAFEGIAIGEKGVLVDANEAFADIYRGSLDELIGTEIMELVAPEDRALVMGNIRSGCEDAYEHRGIRKDGSLIDLEIHGRNVTRGGRRMRLTAIRDVTERKRAERELEERLKFETLVAELSAKFVNLPSREIDTEIENGIRNVVEFLGIDQGGFLEFSEDKSELNITHSYAAPGTEPIPDMEVASRFTWLAAKIGRGESICISSPDDLPNEAEEERRCAQDEGYKAILLSPLKVGGSILGALTLGPLKYKHFWSEQTIWRAQLVGEIFANALVRKRSEIALRQSEEHYRAVVEDQTELVCRYLSDLTITFANEAYCRYFGKTREELIGRKFVPMIPEEDHPKVEEHFASLGPDNLVATHEHRVIDRNGDLRWQQWTNRAILDEAGEIREFQGTGRDVTDRKKAQKAVRESEEKYRLLVESAGQPIFTVDRQGVFTFMNVASAVALGGKAKDFVGKSMWDLFPPEMAHAQMAEITKAIESGRLRTSEKESMVKGQNRWYSARIQPLKEADGAYSRALVILADITDRKEAEEKARRHQSELAHVWRVNTMGEMASGLAHELNQPLCAILNYANACLRMMKVKTDVAEEILEPIEQVASEASRAGEIIKRIRSLVAKRKPQTSAVDINHIVEEVVGLEKAEAVEKKITVQTKLARNLPQVMVDSVEIEEVILNLVRNAFDAVTDPTVERREVTIVTRKAKGNMVEVCVKDTGKGFAALGQQIFDSFFTTKPNGLGIGLSISRTIVELHGGKIWAEAKKDCGASFKFTLPVKRG